MPASPPPALVPAQLQPPTYEDHGLNGLGIPNLIAPLVLDNATSTTRTITTQRDLLPGSKLFLTVGSRSTTNVTISSVSSSASMGPLETFTAQNALQLTSMNIAVATVLTLIPFGTTLTITQSGSTGKSEIAGFTVDGLIDMPVDASVSANASTGAISSGNTGTLDQPDEFVFAGVAQSGAGSRVTAPTSGYQRLYEGSVSVGASPQLGYGEWKTVAATTAVSSAPTTSDTGSAWGVLVVTYRLTSGWNRMQVKPVVVGQSVSMASVW